MNMAWASPKADVAFAERTALLAADAKCDLLAPNLRAALSAAARQAETALLRAGWTQARARDLGARAAVEGRKRACGDPALAKAVADARLGFDGWTRLHAMDFRSGDSLWRARRSPDSAGFVLRQDTTSPRASMFGVRNQDGALSLSIVAPLTAGETPPASAHLTYRDVARARTSGADLPNGASLPLARRAAPVGAATHAIAQSRNRITLSDRKTQAVVFSFPDYTVHAILALDPREAVIIDLGATRLLFEVGDFAAAHAFLSAGSAR